MLSVRSFNRSVSLVQLFSIAHVHLHDRSAHICGLMLYLYQFDRAREVSIRSGGGLNSTEQYRDSGHSPTQERDTSGAAFGRSEDRVAETVN